jgi:hypothetical protein
MITDKTKIIIHFEYEHSYHEIKIYLERESITPIIPWIHILPFALIILVFFSIWEYYSRKVTSELEF